MKKNFKGNKGITLIALVITIIILIILAGVSINLILGENGLVTKAKVGAENYQIAANEETGLLTGLANEIDANTPEKIGKLTLSETEGNYTSNETKTFEVTENESGGELSVETDAPEVATASISGNTVTVTAGTTAGEATITVKSAAIGKYIEQTVTYTATVENGTINLSATPYNGNYDGTAHNALTNVTAIPSDCKIEYKLNDGNYTETMPQVAGADTYTVTVKASKEGYITETITETVIVGKQTNTNGNLTLSEYSGTVTYGSNKTFTITNNKSGGALSVTSSNTNLIAVSISGTTITLVPQVNTAGNATITVKSAATANYEEQTAIYIITVRKAEITLSATAYSGTYNGYSHNALTGVTVNPSDCTLRYKIDSGSYTTTMPTVTNAGNYQVTIEASKTGYETKTITKTVTVDRIREATAVGEDKSYTGSSQTGVSGNYVTWSGTIEETEAGIYTAYATPIENYAWSDGTTGQKRITWEIIKKPAPTISFSNISFAPKDSSFLKYKYSFTISSDSGGTFTMESKGGGTSSITSAGKFFQDYFDRTANNKPVIILNETDDYCAVRITIKLFNGEMWVTTDNGQYNNTWAANWLPTGMEIFV